MTVTVDYSTARPADVADLLAARRAMRERHLAELAADDAAIAELELVASLDEDADLVATLDRLAFPRDRGFDVLDEPWPPPHVPAALPTRLPGAAVPLEAFEFHPERGDPAANIVRAGTSVPADVSAARAHPLRAGGVETSPPPPPTN